jgi:hypothetical protein
MAFWRWFDRGARVDFAGTLLGLIFDWRTWLAGIFGGGGVTFLWAAIEGRSPLEVYLMAIFAVACFVVIIAGIAAAMKTIKRPAFEILYDHSDTRFARPLAAGGFQYHAALHIFWRHAQLIFPMCGH